MDKILDKVHDLISNQLSPGQAAVGHTTPSLGELVVCIAPLFKVLTGRPDHQLTGCLSNSSCLPDADSGDSWSGRGAPARQRFTYRDSLQIKCYSTQLDLISQHIAQSDSDHQEGRLDTQ
jgi:hypothetical protein